jgi:hypothetical protein
MKRILILLFFVSSVGYSQTLTQQNDSLIRRQIFNPIRHAQMFKAVIDSLDGIGISQVMDSIAAAGHWKTSDVSTLIDSTTIVLDGNGLEIGDANRYVRWYNNGVGGNVFKSGSVNGTFSSTITNTSTATTGDISMQAGNGGLQSGIFNISNSSLTFAATNFPDLSFYYLTPNLYRVQFFGVSPSSFIVNSSDTISIQNYNGRNSTMSLFASEQASGFSKIVNIGTGGSSGSSSTINIGSAVSGVTGTSVFNSPTINLYAAPADADNASDQILFRSAETGNLEKLGIGSGLSISGSNLTASSGGGGDVTKVGTPVDNQVGVWTGDGTIEGTTGLTYNGTALGITGNITVSGTVDGIDIATDVAANTAKVSNATHTGDVTGATALTISAGAVDEAMTSITGTASSGNILGGDWDWKTTDEFDLVTNADLRSSRTETTSTATVQTDQFNVIYMNSGSALNLTVDALLDGTQVYVENIGAGTVSIVDGATVTSSGATEILSGQSALILYRTGTTPIIKVAGGTTPAIEYEKSLVLYNPSSSENISVTYFKNAVTITQVSDAIQGSTPSVTYQINHASTRNDGSPNAVFGSGRTLTSASGATTTSFSDATIPAGSWVWLTTSAASGTITDTAITITYTID